MREYRWFARGDLAAWPETIYPVDLCAMLDELDARANGQTA